MDTILTDIAAALTDHESQMFGSLHFVDLTEREVVFIQQEYMFEDDEITEEQIQHYHDWEQAQIRAYMAHDLIRIDPMDSSESYRIMEDFVQTRPQHEQQRLERALEQRHPFSAFRNTVEQMDISQQWYNYKNEAELQWAHEWMEDNGLEIRDGKIRQTDNQ